MKRVFALCLAGCAAMRPGGGTTAEKALEAAEAHVDVAPRDAAARRDLGWLAWMAGDARRARVELGKAASWDGGDALSVLGLAMLADDAGREEDAEGLYLTAVELGEPETAREALRRLGADTERDHAASVARLEALAGGPLAAEVLEVLAAWSKDDRYSARRGCVAAWRALGPIGRAPHVELLRPPPSRPPSVGEGARPLPAPRCRALLRSPGARQGRFLLEAPLPAGVRGEAVVELELDNVDALARLWVGDRLVVRRDSARRFLPGRLARAVTVRGGEKVVVELASLGEPIAISVRVRRGRPPAAAPARSGGIADELVRLYLGARAALRDGDWDAAAARVAALEARAPKWTRAGEVAADLGMERPGRPRLSARDEGRRRLARVLATDPGAARIRLRLAAMHHADGDAQAALDDLGSLDHWRAWTLRARIHGEKDREAQAGRALARAKALSPRACPVALVAEERAQELANAAREAAARALVACDPDSTVLARFARESGDAALLLAERERLARRRPDDPDRQAELARALAAAGRAGEGRAVLERVLAIVPHSGTARLALADLAAAGGDDAAARAVLEEGLARAPEAESLAEARRLLGGADRLARWRIDGKAVIRAFEAEKRRWDAPAVLVLDRTVVRFLPDATRVSLTHNIIRVLQKDGLDRWGEIQIPEGAEILLARTVKQNGATREPESLAKEGLTAPDLDVGDYVETEHVVVERPQQAWARAGGAGVVGDRFYFGTFEAPLDRTELLVVSPPNLAVSFDTRGDAPAPVVSRDADGSTITTFAARRREQLVPEPVSPPYAEYVASTVPYAGVDLDAWRDWLAEQTYGARRGDRELEATARRLTAGTSDPRARARALYRFVTEKIDDAGGLSEEPSLILSRRRGRRAVLLVALAEAAGIRAELWFARVRTSGLGPPPPTQLDELAYPLVRLELPGGPVLLDVRWKRGAFGWLPAAVRGAPAVVVPDPERAPSPGPAALVSVPEAAPEVRVLSLDVDLAADGSARVEARETLTGENAALWRDQAAETPPEEIREELEQRSLGYYFPGSTLRSIELEGAADRDAPLAVVYRFDVPRYARAGGVPVAPLPLQLSRRYVLVGARETAVALGEGILLRATVRVKLPAPLPAAHRRAEAHAPAGAGSFVQDVTIDGKSLVVRSEALLTPYARVPAADYEAFARFCAEVDAAESQLVR